MPGVGADVTLIIQRLMSAESNEERKAHVAQEDLATDIGVVSLRAGGNAVDAAVAVGFALEVTHPFAGALGGGGYMLIRLADGRTTFIDFREKAPEKTSGHDMYLDADGKLTRDSLEGWRSPGVPGTVRGFEVGAVGGYGRLKWAEDMAPAIELASKGFRLLTHSQKYTLGTSRSLAGGMTGIEAHLF